ISRKEAAEIALTRLRANLPSLAAREPTHQRWWVVEVVEALGRDEYPFRVTGWNRHTCEPFSWVIPYFDRRYDLSQAHFRISPAVFAPRGRKIQFRPRGRDWD